MAKEASCTDPLNPTGDITTQRSIPIPREKGSPSTAVRRGVILEAFAQSAYNRQFGPPVTGSSLLGPPSHPQCTCPGDAPRRDCIACLLAVREVLNGPLSRLGGFLDAGGEEEKIIDAVSVPEDLSPWPVIYGLLSGNLEHARRDGTALDTPDRIDSIEGELIGTEFKTGKAELSEPQRIYARAQAELGIRFVVVRPKPGTRAGLHPGGMCRVPFGDALELGTLIEMKSQHAESIEVEGSSLVSYWHDRGVEVGSMEPVWDVEVGPHFQILSYPASVIEGYNLGLELVERIDPPDDPFPWTQVDFLVKKATQRKEVEQKARRERQADRGRGECLNRDQVEPFVDVPSFNALEREYQRRRSEIEESFKHKKKAAREEFGEKREEFVEEMSKRFEEEFWDVPDAAEEDYDRLQAESNRRENEILDARRAALKALDREKKEALAALNQRYRDTQNSWRGGAGQHGSS